MLLFEIEVSSCYIAYFFLGMHQYHAIQSNYAYNWFLSIFTDIDTNTGMSNIFNIKQLSDQRCHETFL